MSDNLLDRMAAALRWASALEARESLYDSILTTEICGSCAATLRGRDGYVGQHDPKCIVGVLLAEYDRVKARTVVLTFEPVTKRILINPADYIVLCDPPRDITSDNEVDPNLGDYAFAELPPLPKPEDFQ